MRINNQKNQPIRWYNNDRDWGAANQPAPDNFYARNFSLFDQTSNVSSQELADTPDKLQRTSRQKR